MSQLGPTAAATPLADHELLAALRDTGGPRHERALGELHAMLLRAARFELVRRAAELAHVRGEDRDDLALQAADDAFVAVLAKLAGFRGDSRFSTWAYKFALYEAAVRVRRRAWQHREVVLDPERWLAVRDGAGEPPDRLDRAELLTAVRALIATALTDRQRTVLVALTIQGIPIDVLAERLGSTRGALYKTLHDARRRLRAELAARGHDLDAIAS
ncbi:MAG TPA: sigma-70 family RNA polymerase sigma factor [Baekduia sp.]|nr:sigma-70 family RNA polymerase sigma factor [Baekduia sp.]